MGATLTEIGGIRVTVAVPMVELSAWLFAVMVTLCCAAMAAGAVYNPAAVIVPADADHVTAGLEALVTVALNCWV